MIIGQPLYKRTSTNAVQIWFQSLNETGDGYRTTSGQKDGKLVVSEWTICEGKNLGRANATTPQQQAILEVEANYRKKLAQGGYFESLDEIDQEKFFKPMLAKEFGDYVPSDDLYERGLVYSQPKLDGMRLIVNSSGVWSRNGKPVPAVPHIYEAVRPLFEKHGDDLVFDGEAYNHDLRDDFDTLMSLVKKSKPTGDDLAESAAKIQYHLYDLPSCAAGFEERVDQLVDLVLDLPADPILNLVPTHLVTNRTHLDSLLETYLDNRYEGQMVRIGGSHYENKRTKKLLKRKLWQDAEFEIADILEGEGNSSGMAGKVLLYLPDRRDFKANATGTRDYRRELLARRLELRGKPATVKFFSYTPDGKPRFGSIKAIHETARM